MKLISCTQNYEEIKMTAEAVNKHKISEFCFLLIDP